MIQSPHNPRIKAVAKLQRQGRERRRTHRFCIESDRELGRATDAGFEVDQLYAVAEWLEAHGERVAAAQRQGAAVDAVAPHVLAKMAYRENPQGFVAVMRARTTPLQDIALDATDASGAASPVIVCSGLEKPGNIGAILRSAAAAGAAAMLIDRPEYDLFNPNTIRASTGAVFAVPVACATREQVHAVLRDRGVRIAALMPDAETAYTDADWREPWAVVLGAEAEGLDPAWRAAADAAVRIPHATDAVDSLNVSVTAAVVLFEAARQRASRR